jgi:hypothetical protein
MFFNFYVSKGSADSKLDPKKRLLTVPSESTKSAYSRCKFIITPKSIFTEEDPAKMTSPSEGKIVREPSETSHLKFRSLK